jgi:hypothetical protein
MIKIKGIEMSEAAARNCEEAGCDPVADREEIVRCGTTRVEFEQFCLNGADGDRVNGWHDYVDAVFADLPTVAVSSKS